MMSFYSRRWVVLALVSGIAGSAAGCTGAQTASGKASSPSPVHVAVEPLSEEQFVQQVATLLKEGDHDADRLRELGAVVHHTLSRAGLYFERGLEDQALQTVMGAFFLVRSGELHPKTLQGQGTVLLQAADAAARRGDEGRARAWYELVRECGDGATAKRAGEHIQALSQWEADTRRDGSMQSVSAQRLAAMKRALVRRDAQSVEQAREAVVTWVERAVEASQNDEPIQSIFDHDERMAARLAFIAGAQNMIALYLRDGDAGGALAALNTDTMAAVTEPRWMTGLIAAAEGNGEAWLDWFRRFQAAVEQPELFDPDVARGALWGSAVELYRAQPNSLGATLPVASLLVEHGMADVAPLLLVSAYDEGKEKPDTDAQEKQMVERQALRLLFEALLRSERNEDLPLARRVFDNAAPIIDRYQAPTDSQGPAAVDFYELMGSLETRAGHLDRAYTHLERAVELRPSIESFRLLSSIERHREEYKPALATLERLLALAEAERLPLATVQGLLMSYDVLLDQGQAEVAPRFLEKALQELLALRTYLDTDPRDFLAVATPGAGKTTFALRVATELLSRGEVRSITVVAPTEHLKGQWAEAAARVGIQLDPAFRNAQERHGASFDGVAVTYAQVAANPDLHRRRTTREPTLVILDEIHHGGDALSWGDGIRLAFEPAQRRLAPPPSPSSPTSARPTGCGARGRTTPTATPTPCATAWCGRSSSCPTRGRCAGAPARVTR